MGNYPVGRLIFELRRRKGVSQEFLAEGICSVSTVSKIENGVQMPSRKVYEALLQRLGGSTRNCRLYISDYEMHKYVLEEKITQCMERKCYAEAARLLKEYESHRNKKEEDRLEKQFALLVRAELQRCRKDGRGKALDLLWQAARISMPDLELEQLEQYRLLMLEEIRILERMAEIYYELGDSALAKRILFFLKEYTEYSEMDEMEKAQIYPKLVYRLACWMEADGRHQEQKELCESGIRMCILQGRLTEYPMLLAGKGYALLESNQPEEAEPCLKQACAIFRAVGDPANAGLIKEKATALFHAQ